MRKEISSIYKRQEFQNLHCWHILWSLKLWQNGSLHRFPRFSGIHFPWCWVNKQKNDSQFLPKFEHNINGPLEPRRFFSRARLRKGTRMCGVGTPVPEYIMSIAVWAQWLSIGLLYLGYVRLPYYVRTSTVSAFHRNQISCIGIPSPQSSLAQAFFSCSHNKICPSFPEFFVFLSRSFPLVL